MKISEIKTIIEDMDEDIDVVFEFRTHIDSMTNVVIFPIENISLNVSDNRLSLVTTREMPFFSAYLKRAINRKV